MINFFNSLYALIKNRNKLLDRYRFYSLLRFLIRVTANKVLPFYFSITKDDKSYSLKSSSPKKKQVIVSLTSFPARIDRVWLVVESILRQTEKPDKIILWLSLDQFPSLNHLPEKLLKQRDRGLQIALREGDLRSHKKYYYTRKEFPNDILVTVDDDIFYPSHTIKELIKWHNIFQDSIIARYGFKIKVVNNKISSYKTWDKYYNQQAPNSRVFFGSGGGTLFPPYSLPEETLNKDLLSNLCLYADDVWLNTMCRINNTKVFKTEPNLCSILPVTNKNNVSLSTKNLYEDMNDKQLQDVRDYYILHSGIDPYNENTGSNKNTDWEKASNEKG